MKDIAFFKAHALSNDFIVIDAAEDIDYARFAKKICARHTGIGADGCLVIEPQSAGADFGLRIFNADGSEAEMSGNGIRCAAASLYFSGRFSEPKLKIATLSGVKELLLLSGKAHEKHFHFEVDMGEPIFEPEKIPIRVEYATKRVVDYPLLVAGREVKVTATSVGNPHCSVFVEDFDSFNWREIGAALELHEKFPNRTNVEFVKVVSATELQVRLWERGVGETESSGTGACGAALAAILGGKVEDRVAVKMPAGEILVEWRTGSKIYIEGSAEIVCSGLVIEE
ncbi:MAG: diaminopimelate epimerase [Blastocatellia bacterium]|nr:diaminopimelate epimerase [Blastocatellia bacterium]